MTSSVSVLFVFRAYVKHLPSSHKMSGSARWSYPRTSSMMIETVEISVYDKLTAKRRIDLLPTLGHIWNE